MNKKLAGAGAAAIAAATAVTALLLGSTTAVADESGVDSAYGIAATGLLNIAPKPFVESADGSPQHAELAGLPANGTLSAGLLTVDAEAGKASSSVANLNVTGVLKGQLITTSCVDGEGSLEIVGGSLLGTALPRFPVAGQEIDASPLAKVTLGKETRNEDGSLTVTGITLTVLPVGTAASTPLTGDQKAALPDIGGLLGVQLPGNASTVGDVLGSLPGGLGSSGAQTIVIGSATCAAHDGDGDGGDHHGDDGDHHGDGDEADGGSGDHASGTGAEKEAPKPQVVQANLPVTG